MLTIIKKEISDKEQGLKMVTFKLEGINASYSLIIQRGLFSEMAIHNFMKMMMDYIIMDDENVEIIEGEKIRSDQIVQYLLQ
jgi:hypothetical protein